MTKTAYAVAMIVLSLIGAASWFGMWQDRKELLAENETMRATVRFLQGQVDAYRGATKRGPTLRGWMEK